MSLSYLSCITFFVRDLCTFPFRCDYLESSWPFHGLVGSVYRFAWSADSRMVFSTRKDGIVKARLVHSRARLCSHSHNRIAFASTPFSLIQTWDPQAHKLKNDPMGHINVVYYVGFTTYKIVNGGRLDSQKVSWYYKSAVTF